MVHAEIQREINNTRISTNDWEMAMLFILPNFLVACPKRDKEN